MLQTSRYQTMTTECQLLQRCECRLSTNASDNTSMTDEARARALRDVAVMATSLIDRRTVGQISRTSRTDRDDCLSYAIRDQLAIQSRTRASRRYFALAIRICQHRQRVTRMAWSHGRCNRTSRQRLRDFTIPLPPTKAEQEAIAEALSDADALIESLEQLLAKKRQIKQGAMQELLTGKKRLPGFSGEWKLKRLGDDCRRLEDRQASRRSITSVNSGHSTSRLKQTIGYVDRRHGRLVEALSSARSTTKWSRSYVGGSTFRARRSSLRDRKRSIGECSIADDCL